MNPDRWSTHSVEVGAHTVVKRFHLDAEDRRRREWTALRLLDEYASGLAPRPLECGVDRDGGFIRMSRLPGTPLRGGQLNRHQQMALAETTDALHGAVPEVVLADVPTRPAQQDGIFRQIDRWCGEGLPVTIGQEVDDALSVGLGWLNEHRFRIGGWCPQPVFGPGDGNLANYLWDGYRVRVLDFEDSGRSDRPYEIAEITEHVSSWRDGALDSNAFIRRLDLTAPEQERLRDCRRLLALVWLFLLARDEAESCPRNPPGTATSQAKRLLRLLGRDR